MNGTEITKFHQNSESTDSGEIPLRAWWKSVLLGLAAGSGGALIGVGGGVIMVPVLTLWGFTQKRAQGTSLAVIFAMSPVAIFTYYKLGNINVGFALPLAAGGIIGAWIGSNAAQCFSNKILSRAFGVFLILTAVKMFLGGDVVSAGTENSFFAREILEGGCFGILAGIVAGFFGVGGGVVFVPTGVLLANLQQATAQGSSFTAILPTSLSGAIGYSRKKEIDWRYIKWLIPGALIGSVFGAYGADIIPGKQLGFIFSAYLLYTGLKKLAAKN